MNDQFAFLVTLFCTSDSSLSRYAVQMSSNELDEHGGLDSVLPRYREHEAFWLSKLPEESQGYPVVDVDWIEGIAA